MLALLNRSWMSQDPSAGDLSPGVNEAGGLTDDPAAVAVLNSLRLQTVRIQGNPLPGEADLSGAYHKSEWRVRRSRLTSMFVRM
ncbi:MAG: hypothetical protein OXM02_01215 [Bacteroidota bacterium]|nr:hypothetical protein [Bacteroidota bacterium]MDE2833125.1 hypothetical protein [Bacteroidota bacterium]MDE2955896.1 hypothetical protein [Bacteroidota bacterium]